MGVQKDLLPWEAEEMQRRQLRQIADAGIGLNLLLNANCYGADSLSRSFFQSTGDLVDMLKQMNRISRDLEFSMRNMRNALSDQNLDKINRTIANIERSTASLMQTASQEELGETLRNLNTFLQESRTFLPAASRLANSLTASTGPAGQLAETVTLLHNMTTQISALLERLDDNPDALLRGNRSPKVNKE